MSSVSILSSESNCNYFKETELSLGLSGGGGANKTRSKRGFSDTAADVDLHLATSSSEGSANSYLMRSNTTKFPASKAQVVGWPPVRASRKNAMRSCNKYVKVAVDGAPYLRKVNLEMYQSYDHLLAELGTMFSCLTIRNDLMNERKVMDGKGIEYMPTYEDKDGDWMLLGDVPWKMFVESCKRIRLMICSEAVGLGARTTPK